MIHVSPEKKTKREKERNKRQVDRSKRRNAPSTLLFVVVARAHLICAQSDRDSYYPMQVVGTRMKLSCDSFDEIFDRFDDGRYKTQHVMPSRTLERTTVLWYLNTAIVVGLVPACDN